MGVMWGQLRRFFGQCDRVSYDPGQWANVYTLEYGGGEWGNMWTTNEDIWGQSLR